MFAVFETGGKQYKVSEGDIIFVEKLGVEEGEKVTFDRVLAVSRGENTAFGAPYIDGAKICLAFASGWTGTRQVRVVIEYTK